MAAPRLRALLALAVVGAALTPGLALPTAAWADGSGAAGVTPQDPGGGCWRHAPGVGEPGEDDAVLDDLSEQLEPWSDVPPGFTLQTSGETAVGGERSFILTTNAGPEVPDLGLLAIVGTATFRFAVAGAPATELEPIEVPFTVEPGETIPGLVAEGAFEVADAGRQQLVLQGVHYDLPDVALPGVDLPALVRIACNGQGEGVPGGVNPATQPLDTAVVASYVTVAGSTAAVARVTGQRVDTHARPGDVVRVRLRGFASSASGTVALCQPGTTTCGSTTPVTTTAAGTAAVGVEVADTATPGATELVAVVGDRSRRARLRVLDRPAASADQVDRSGGAATFRVHGTEWDPRRKVSVRPIDSSGDPTGRRSRLRAGSNGQFATKIGVGEKTTALRVTQRHGSTTLETEVAIDVDGGGSGSPDADDEGEDSPTGTTTTPQDSSVPSAADEPAADIPLPEARKVTEVPGVSPLDPGEQPAAPTELAVTDPHLEGESTVGELFGASPRRTLVLTVENVTDEVIRTPGLTIAVGRGDDLEPSYRSDGVSTIAPGESRTIEVPITLPVGAFGRYVIAGQVGETDGGRFSLSWETYPWGLIGLNLLGVLLLGWGIRRRRAARRAASALAIAGPPAPAGAAVRPAGILDEAVVDLATLERWWALTAGNPESVGAAGPGPPADLDSVIDVDAVDDWLERRGTRV